MSEILQAITGLAHFRRLLWASQPDKQWLARLLEEVAELAAALNNSHEDPAEWELMQIASICLNWLRKKDAGSTCTRLLEEYGIAAELRREAQRKASELMAERLLQAQPEAAEAEQLRYERE